MTDIPKKLDLNFCDSSETISNLLEIENKINDLIDYLSDKEEASKGESSSCCKGTIVHDYGEEHLDVCSDCGAKQKGIFPCHNSTCPKLYPPQQEESKHAGDIAWCDCECHTKGSPQPKCDKCYIEEESRGECENCAVNKPGGVIAATSDLKHCAVCGRDLFPEDNFPEPQLKEECTCYRGDHLVYKDYCPKHRSTVKEESPKEDEVEKLFKIIEKHGEGTSEGAIYWESWADEPQSLKQELAGYIKANFVSKVKIKSQLSEVEKLFKSVGLVSSLTVRNIIKEVIKGLEEL